MIKAEEIMIGDWVYVDNIPRQVEVITKNKIGYYKNEQNNGRLYYARLHEVEGIKLTDALLEKHFHQEVKSNSFLLQFGVYDIYVNIQRKDYCLLTVENGIFRCDPLMNVGLKNSLHIFQNALRIYNIELKWF